MGVFLRGKPEYYRALMRRRSSIESQLRESLHWVCEEGGFWTVGISKNCDPASRAEWPSQHKWLAARLRDSCESAASCKARLMRCAQPPARQHLQRH
jgi:hypothetical protein